MYGSHEKRSGGNPISDKTLNGDRMPRIFSRRRASAPKKTKVIKSAKVQEPIAELSDEILQAPSFDVYILLDRSGSMASKWQEAISSINSYVNELKNSGIQGGVTLALFDDQAGFRFDVIRTGQIQNWNDVSTWEAHPRGGTPLFDAITKLIGLANKTAPQRAAIVVWTDGMENASRSATRDSTRSLIGQCKERGWQIVFLGADFDATTQAVWLGLQPQSVLNMSAGYYGQGVNLMGASTQAYAARGVAMNFSEQDNARAQGKA